jgi:hypothetical protein
MSKKKDKKKKVLSLKQTNLQGASRKTRALIFIMERKDIRGEIATNTLQP